MAKHKNHIFKDGILSCSLSAPHLFFWSPLRALLALHPFLVPQEQIILLWGHSRGFVSIDTVCLLRTCADSVARFAPSNKFIISGIKETKLIVFLHLVSAIKFKIFQRRSIHQKTCVIYLSTI